MNIIIRNDRGISEADGLGIVYAHVSKHGIEQIIEDCEKKSKKMGTVYYMTYKGEHIVFWAKLNKASLTFNIVKYYD